MDILHQRSNTGLLVELGFDDGDVIIIVTDGGGDPQSAVVPPDKAMDAFNHPFCYLPREVEVEVEPQSIRV